MEGLFSTLSTKIETIPFRERPGLTALATSSAILLPFAVRNYLAFLELKPPGILATPIGWLISLTLRLLARDPRTTEEYDGPNELSGSWLPKDFPRRNGDRPEISWFPAPHRQMNQWSTTDIHKKLTAWIPEVAAANPTTLELRKSEHELLTDALFVASRIKANPPHNTCRAAYGEVAHIHYGFDFSLHVVLSPQDCKKVIQNGWGERHPCAGRVKGLPKEYMMIYVPRNEQELHLVTQIVRAAAAFLSGEEVV